ncbi:uncharacterized protein LOC115630749 [Scaptodrosophila lebanonensis]|uniref:Uncharacterized protein LOC115630749 n=1 Tax=Drosophila lebanonensis TaxID=7225 RepID=A0A6J2U4H3_DROLE|nr:uncharacterized protein LOC115630749 [Scaptodrosophila lebanonensis]
MLRKFGFLLLILAINPGGWTGVRAQRRCMIARNVVQNARRIFLLRNAQNQWSLKRTDSSAVGEVLRLYCNATTITPSTCQPNGAFRPPIATACPRPPFPSAIPIVDRRCRGTAYQVGHRLFGAMHELYRSCYDRRQMRVMYVDHRVFGKSFIPQRPCVAWSADGVITPGQERAFLRGNIYATFQNLFGVRNRYISNNQVTVINRGHLAAAGDFFFGDQMCGTFKYVNAVPQFASINDGNWEAIERWIRSRLPVNSFYNVRTGAVGVLRLADERSNPPRMRDVFLGNRRFPVPLWMYKSIRNAQNQPLGVFLTLNNIYARAMPAPPAFCRRVNCPLQLNNVVSRGFTMCCNPATFNPPH